MKDIIFVHAFLIATCVATIIAASICAYYFFVKKERGGDDKARYAAAIGTTTFFLIIAVILLIIYPTCPSCDNKLDYLNTNYCTDCGEKIRDVVICPTCEKEMYSDYCGACGSKTVLEEK